MPKEWLDLVDKFKQDPNVDSPYGLATKIYKQKYGHAPTEEFIRELNFRLITILEKRSAQEQQNNMMRWWTSIPLEQRSQILFAAKTNTQDPNVTMEDMFPEDRVQLGKYYRDKVISQEKDDHDVEAASLEDVNEWWGNLNQSQRQHAIDPQQLLPWSLALAQMDDFKNLNPDEKIEIIRGFGFRHEEKDVSELIGFDADPTKPETWWGLFNYSMRQHVIDPHKQFAWSLALAKKEYSELTDNEKDTVTKTYGFRHGGKDQSGHKPQDGEVVEEAYQKKDWKFTFSGSAQPHKLLEHPDSCMWRSMQGKPVCIRPGENPSDAFKRLKKREPEFNPAAGDTIGVELRNITF